jgi:Trk-type K+ transport system membrane component
MVIHPQRRFIKRSLQRTVMERDVLYGMSLIVFLVVCAIIAYHFLEGWNYLDSAYFAVSTITTVGYGDLSPHTAAGKVFTIIFMLVGVSTGLYVLVSMGEHREHAFRARFDKVVHGLRSRRDAAREKHRSRSGREGRFVPEKLPDR